MLVMRFEKEPVVQISLLELWTSLACPAVQNLAELIWEALKNWHMLTMQLRNLCYTQTATYLATTVVIETPNRAGFAHRHTLCTNVQ